MRDAKLARRYAEALYRAAREKGQEDKVFTAAEEVLVPLVKDETFQAFWFGYAVPVERRLELVDKVFSKLPDVLRQFLRVLIEKKREAVLTDVLEVLSDLHDKDKGIIRATLTTATELGETEVEPFRKLLADRLGGQLVLRHKVDPSLVAGFRLRYGDWVIDGSVERSIRELRRRLSA